MGKNNQKYIGNPLLIHVGKGINLCACFMSSLCAQALKTRPYAQVKNHPLYTMSEEVVRYSKLERNRMRLNGQEKVFDDMSINYIDAMSLIFSCLRALSLVMMLSQAIQKNKAHYERIMSKLEKALDEEVDAINAECDSKLNIEKPELEEELVTVEDI